jgi:16S rRNA (uracil1498-N3)-methyltransferase
MLNNLKCFSVASSKMQRLFLQPNQAIAAQKNQAINLTKDQQHYLYHVLRCQPQAQFIALDGCGNWWLAQLAKLEAEPATILETYRSTPRASCEVTLAIAMPKGNGMESIIKQATEIGVDRIMPLWSDRTVIKNGTELGRQKIERWNRIAQEAAELACSAHVPQISMPQNYREWVRQTENGDRYICMTHSTQKHLHVSLRQASSAPEIVVLIGAEGGWSEAEAELAIAYKWQPVSLGNQILSALTAPVVALSLVSAFLELRQIECNQESLDPKSDRPEFLGQENLQQDENKATPPHNI